GLVSISLESGDELVAAGLAKEQEEIILLSEKGQSIRFATDKLRAASRTSRGVRGIRLSPGDGVVGMVVIYPNACLLTVTSKGFGKLSPISAYSVQRRGGKGIQTHKVGDKVGKVVAAKLTSPSEELMIISKEGVIIRLPLEKVRIQRRNTQGVSLMRLEPDNEVVSIACLRVKGEDKPSQREKVSKSKTNGVRRQSG
ncbi:MAG TPA: DNA gyrase C-terminal beta-propeller domain-containing protein, partial [Dehalococcoidia bacterium]|nr:DNA gyrase C-terminal beta-propeller domain-containing protein [Dehalococcoidia bacterium]